MPNVLTDALSGYWTPEELATNVKLLLNILGALVLGLLVGYERFYRGRAAGMRTYGLVCMASCALTVITGDTQFWYGGHVPVAVSTIDPGRVIQGITTGIGFLGAGVIMRDGMSISGLTTAASIWAVAAIGVLVGVGFYSAAILMAFVSAGFMMWGAKIENLLPSRHAISITLHFIDDLDLTQGDIDRLVHAYGYDVAKGSFSVNYRNGQPEWKFVAVSYGRDKSLPIIQLSERFKKEPSVTDFQISHARN